MPGAPVSLFPPKSQPKKLKGAVGFRARPDHHEYLQEQESKGYPPSDVLRALVDLGIDVEKEIGRGLEEFRELARIQDVRVGVVVGRAAKLGLEALKEKLKK